MLDAKRQRGILQELRQEYRAKPNAIIQSSYLQIEFALQNNKGQYQLNVNQNSGVASRSTERKINQNDDFHITHLGLFLKKEDSTKPGSVDLQTYPNGTHFGTTTEAGNYVYADLEAFWNSSLYCKVGNTVFGEAIDLNPCRVAQTTQQSSATTKSEHLSFDGYVECEPRITLSGIEKNDVFFNMAQWAGQLIQFSTANAGATIYGVFRPFGYLISGVR
jgi:hypothetical protein